MNFNAIAVDLLRATVRTDPRSEIAGYPLPAENEINRIPFASFA